MNKILIPVLLCLSLTAPAALAAEDGGVARAAFSSGIEGREPVDELTALDAGAEKVYFFTELRGMAGQIVVHRWLHAGRSMAEISFEVGGPRWRVWSSKTLLPQWHGQWTVEVIDGAGRLLERKSFDYGTP